ncbi:MAG: patatin-like phospholipase family protein [Defluviitaleaceae bacterium]|nr:patatin-like phospholipase family protein [Defluviitaleaceae bacterium]
MCNIGLVLSGGMAKGAYQIGALRAIGEFFDPSDFKYVSSASVGALNTYVFLTNAMEKGIEIWSSVSGGNVKKWATSILKSDFMQQAVRKIAASSSAISNTCYIPLVSIKKRKLIYVDIGKVPPQDIEPYLQASIAMPVFNASVLIDGEYFYDGAIVDNIPIQPILQHPIDYIICIYFDEHDYIFENELLDNKVIKMNFSDNKIISSSICMTDDSIQYMIEEGYARAMQILQQVFASGTENLDAVYKQIEQLNKASEKKNLRITGDVIVNNMNRVVKKFINKIEIV